MPITEQQTGERDGQPIMKDVYRCDWCGNYGHAIKTEGSKTTIGCWACSVPTGETPFNPTDGACHVTHWMPLPKPPTP